MFKERYLELLCRKPVPGAGVLNHKLSCVGKVAQFTSEWNTAADRADCQTLVVDCSNVQLLSSALLSKLILLQRRLKVRNAGWCLPACVPTSARS